MRLLTMSVRHIFRVRCAANARGHVCSRDLKTDAMSCAEEIGCGHQLDSIFRYSPRRYFSLCGTRQWMPGPPGLRALRIRCTMRGFKPTACYLPLGKIVRKLALAFAHGAHGNVWTYIL